MLIVMAGLPAAGKSSVAQRLGRALPAVVVPVDPVEAAMWRAGVDRAQPTGLAAYLVAEAVADGVLALGQSAVIDAVNAVEAARRQWRALADRHRVSVAFIEAHRLVLDSTADLASNVTKAQEYLAAGTPPSPPERH
ncbi:AAA family ATPase [Streptomyces mirabilis]|uniref:AAA family ATPase n=1 Tax=Streptomyces mirabilis TaxID=68239 RepID=UPI0033325213